MGGCLLYMAAYMPMPVLLSLLKQEFWHICLAWIGGMFLSGAFNAYLGDTYRRKHVFMAALAGMLVSIGGYVYAESVVQFTILAVVHGACFGVASSAGVTVSIDITVSGNRTRGNEIYALGNRIGMFIGIALGICLFPKYGQTDILFLSIALGLIGILEIASIYLPFRAPIGMNLVNLDRFILLRALVPALNVILLAIACMLILYWTKEMSILVYILFSIIPLLFVTPLIRMFVKLSHHCQRGTGNTTFNLAADAGCIAGLAIAAHLEARQCLASFSIAFLLSALLLLATVSYPYYKKKRVR